jgi:hypothetical protein
MRHHAAASALRLSEARRSGIDRHDPPATSLCRPLWWFDPYGEAYLPDPPLCGKPAISVAGVRTGVASCASGRGSWLKSSSSPQPPSGRKLFMYNPGFARGTRPTIAA